MKTKKNHYNYFEQCETWWIRFRWRFPRRRGPCNVVCRSFWLRASQFPVRRFLSQPKRNSILFRLVFHELVLKKKKQFCLVIIHLYFFLLKTLNFNVFNWEEKVIWKMMAQWHRFSFQRNDILAKRWNARLCKTWLSQVTNPRVKLRVPKGVHSPSQKGKWKKVLVTEIHLKNNARTNRSLATKKKKKTTIKSNLHSWTIEIEIAN